jgi:hypothetical protein
LIFYQFVTLYPQSCIEETGDKRDVVKLVQKCLNRSVDQRKISKQKAMCELSRKPMVICSEVIETVSLSGYTKLSTDGNYNTSKTLLTKYRNRTIDLHLSFHDFFYKMKNQSSKKGREYVPHYVGGSGQPVYPVTENYARIENFEE